METVNAHREILTISYRPSPYHHIKPILTLSMYSAKELRRIRSCLIPTINERRSTSSAHSETFSREVGGTQSERR